MAAPIQGTVGIVPAGALGVSLFYHLTRQLEEIDGRIFFMERKGSTSMATLRSKGELLIADARKVHHVPARGLFKPDMVTAYERDELPEILLVCPNPDQLFAIVSEMVSLLEAVFKRNELENLPIPIVVLASNGIYYQRLRQIYLEKLEESTLLGRLPDLWPDLMPRIVGRILRGISIQTGVREGSGAETIYRPGPRGITRLAGGDAGIRERCCALLSGRGAWFELATHSSATRLEFDKAMVNLSSNLLGQLYAIDDEGRFRSMTLGEIVTPAHNEAIRELCHRVFEIGIAVRAYAADDDFEDRLSTVKATLLLHAEHVPSSLQWVALRLRTGDLDPNVTPTESWLLDPLIRYARSAGMEDAAHYFETFRDRLLEKLRRLCNSTRAKRA
jgi:hypothetical protein